MSNNALPLANIRVIELSHMVMGPSMGLILGDLGADVIKIEPPGGDKTRRLKGSGAGYFTMYNRNKRSLCVDLKTDEGKALVHKLIADADVFVENFREGSMDRQGFGYDQLAQINPRLIYCSARGFLSGPYEHRTALDEVAQMMGGLAYMTGPPGRPLRAGASVIDVAGGMFGVIAILSALEARHQTGKGQKVSSALYESTAFFVGQHMAQLAVTGEPAKPMPVRISAWAIYDIFETVDDKKMFIAVVSDTQWPIFCTEFGFNELGADTSLSQNAGRVAARDTILPTVRNALAKMTAAELAAKLERCGLPYAPIARPEDLFDDPHLCAGGLVDVTVPGGDDTRLPGLPISMDGQRTQVHHNVPNPGENSLDVLRDAGLSDSEIDALLSAGVVTTE